MWRPAPIDRGTSAGSLACAGAAWLLFAAAPAGAQELLREVADLSDEADAVQESVGKRKRPEFEPLGLMLGDILGRAGRGEGPHLLGSFTLLPKLELGATTDDNVFRAERGKRSDLASSSAVKFDLKSDFARHAFNLRGRGELGRFVDLASENYEDFLVEASPRIDISAFEQLRLRGSYALEHQSRGDVGQDFATAESIPVRRARAEADWRFQRGAFSSRARYRFADTDYRDAGGVDNDFLDSELHRINLRGGYEAQQGVTLWLEPGLLWQRFPNAALGGLARDSEGWQVLAGFTYDLSAVTFVELGAGYVTRRFDDPGLDEIGDIAAEARAVWNVRPLVTLEALLARNVRAVQVGGASAAIDTGFEAAAFWDPRENLILELRGGLHHLDYATLPGAERSEDEAFVRLVGRYLLNPNLHLRLKYEYSTLASDIAGESYDANVFTLTAILQL